MDRTLGYDVKRKKPYRERQIVHDFTHTWKITNTWIKRADQWLTEEKRVGKWVRGIKGHICTMMDKIQTTWVEHNGVYSEIDKQDCTVETVQFYKPL